VGCGLVLLSVGSCDASTMDVEQSASESYDAEDPSPAEVVETRPELPGVSEFNGSVLKLPATSSAWYCLRTRFHVSHLCKV